jgi:hypothetical protein
MICVLIACYVPQAYYRCEECRWDLCDSCFEEETILHARDIHQQEKKGAAEANKRRAFMASQEVEHKRLAPAAATSSS